MSLFPAQAPYCDPFWVFLGPSTNSLFNGNKRPEPEAGRGTGLPTSSRSLFAGSAQHIQVQNTYLCKGAWLRGVRSMAVWSSLWLLGDRQARARPGWWGWPASDPSCRGLAEVGPKNGVARRSNFLSQPVSVTWNVSHCRPTSLCTSSSTSFQPNTPTPQHVCHSRPHQERGPA